MSINATIGLNAYIKEYVRTALHPGDPDAPYPTGNFYPGRQAPLTEQSNRFVTYRVTPGDTYGLFGLKRDIVSYTFYNPGFLDLHNVVRLVMKAINVEDIQASSLSKAGIIYQDAYMTTGAPGESTDVDGEEFYQINGEIVLIYTEA